MILSRSNGVIRGVLAVSLVATLSACAGGGGGFGLFGEREERVPDLMQTAQSQRSPDEFAILPNKPIEIPEELASTLPEPTPGTGNRVDPTPRADAVAALGGDPSRVVARGAGFASADSALVSAASRYGVAAGIRDDLAASDLEFRRDNQGLLMERLFNVNVYYKSYRSQSLDQYRELERFRRAGIRTVGAPPNPEE